MDEQSVRWDDLRAMGVVMKRAQYFLTTPDHKPHLIGSDPGAVRRRIVGGKAEAPQLSLFAPAPLRAPQSVCRAGAVSMESAADLKALADKCNPLVGFWDPMNLAEYDQWSQGEEAAIGFAVFLMAGKKLWVGIGTAIILIVIGRVLTAG